MHWIRAWMCVGTIAFGLACGEEPPQRAPAQPHATMDQIFEAMAFLLPASVDAAGFASEDARASIQERLDLLTLSAAQLESHARADEATFGQLSHSLASDAAAIRERYAAGRYEDARQRLLGSIRNCVDCHSLQPSALRFPMAERLLERVEMQALLPHERALIHVVTRRMPEALTIWEELLVDPEVPAAQLDAAGVLHDYLAVAVRVQRDLERARLTLERVAQRSDLPPHLPPLLRSWTRALAKLAPDADAPPSLERARQLAEDASAESRWPAERAGLIQDLLASSILLELVERERQAPGSLTSESLAEAYYRLGEIEVRGLDPFSASQAELHLATAIRIAPGGPFAEPAFRLLESGRAAAYGGLSGPQLPEDLRAQLTELRALIDTSSG